MEREFLSLIEKDRAFVWHPFTQMKTARVPPLIKRGEGVYLYSEDGKKYLDGISSWWVNLHGHAHPYISLKIKEQMEKLEHVIFADFTHEPAIQTAEKLVSLLPGNMSRIFYTDNGSTAVEAALKIALQYWHNQNRTKKKVICFRGSFHGETFGAMSAAGKNSLNRPFWSHLFAVESIDPPFTSQEEAALKQLDSHLEKGDVACFIFEPLILGAGGMRIYSKEVLDLILQKCRENDVLLIADEVMTGFGRTNTLFASENLLVKPDIICLSKGLTGGFLPLGVTACTKKIFEAFLSLKKEKAFLHGHSYTANPLACAAALASLDLLLETACFEKRKEIALLHASFCKKWRFHPKLKRCESLGTILAVEYASEDFSYFHPLQSRLSHYFIEQEIFLRPLGNVLYVLPPYCIKKEDLERIYSYIEITLERDKW